MAGHGGVSELVRSGLVFAVDAADKNSYPGRITDWDDIVGSSHGDKIGSPTFSSNNYGYYTFDGGGSDDGITFADHSMPIYADNFTVEFWCRPTTTHHIDDEGTTGQDGLTHGQGFLWEPYYAPAGVSGAGMGVTLGTNGVSLYEYDYEYFPAICVWEGSVSSTAFSHLVVTYTSKQGRIYLNGALQHTGLTSTKSTVLMPALAVAEFAESDWAGDVALIRAYNRPLSLTEIQSNFNAHRHRFGV